MLDRREFMGLSPLQLERAARAAQPGASLLDRLWLAPWRAMESPDPWQRDVLSQLVTRHENVLALCARGCGKSRVVSAAAYLEACLGGYALVVSRSDRQAMTVFRYVLEAHQRLRLVRTRRENMHEIEFANGGRVVALPCSEETIRGQHGVSLLVIDEAAVVPDSVFGAVTPMVAISKGRMALLSTPRGKRGFFHREWTEGEGWRRHRYTWRDCPRHDAVFIEAERRRHGDHWVAQEYEVIFEETVGSLFRAQDVAAMDCDGVLPLFRGA